MQNIPEIPVGNVTDLLAFIVGLLLFIVLPYLFFRFEKKLKEKDELIRAITKEHLLDIKEGKEESIKLNNETNQALSKHNILLEQLRDIIMRNESRNH